MKSIISLFGFADSHPLEKEIKRIIYRQANTIYEICDVSLCYLNEKDEALFFMYLDNRIPTQSKFIYGMNTEDIDEIKVNGFGELTSRMKSERWQVGTIMKVTYDWANTIQIILPQGLRDGDCSLYFHSKQLARQWFQRLSNCQELQIKRKAIRDSKLQKEKLVSNISTEPSFPDEEEEVEKEEEIKKKQTEDKLRIKKENVEKVCKEIDNEKEEVKQQNLNLLKETKQVEEQSDQIREYNGKIKQQALQQKKQLQKGQHQQELRGQEEVQDVQAQQQRETQQIPKQILDLIVGLSQTIQTDNYGIRSTLFEE